jgi:Ser/Thr protein kinase RdoA (MazF antagonist)
MIEARRAWAGVLEDAKARGELQVRNIHGDPKVDNILISDRSGRAVGMVDLDTVKPGLIQYDLGDCLRSSCNPLGETTDDYDEVRFEIDLAEPILEGYLDRADSFLTPNDYAAIYPAARVMIFEMGLRFFQDYLAGNVYFKVEHPEHNLERAVVQFKLLESLEAQQAAMQTMIKSLLPSSPSPR